MDKCLTLGAILLAVLGCGPATVASAPPVQVEPAPSLDAVWPWKNASKTDVTEGVVRWFYRSPTDGTELELFEFDFAKNKRISFEIYDQDEDDEKPFDNKSDFFKKGVGEVVRHLTTNERGKVLTAWNGLFFGYDRGPGSPPNGFATHIGPVVLRGKMYHNVGRHRWTFGVKYTDGMPQFKTILLPEKSRFEREFDFAADGAQCLLTNGEPTKLEPFPGLSKAKVPGSTEAGHIPTVDYMKTSRTSMAWNKDSSKFYVLIVNEPDTEVASKIAIRHGKRSEGGWMLSDLQRFWVRFGAWGAINSDGGMPTQSTWLRPDGKYELLPSRSVMSNRRLEFDKDFKEAPEGGSLLTFYVTERSGS